MVRNLVRTDWTILRRILLKLRKRVQERSTGKEGPKLQMSKVDRWKLQRIWLKPKLKRELKAAANLAEELQYMSKDRLAETTENLAKAKLAVRVRLQCKPP